MSTALTRENTGLQSSMQRGSQITARTANMYLARLAPSSPSALGAWSRMLICWGRQGRLSKLSRDAGMPDRGAYDSLPDSHDMLPKSFRTGNRLRALYSASASPCK